MKPILTYHGELPILTDSSIGSNGLVSLSVTFKNGSMSETPAVNGVSHFIEHLVFRGSRKYTQEEISKESERLGGYMNAYTTKEQTTFYINGFSGNFDKFMDILLDIAFFPKLSEADFKHEQKVILTEIASLKDSPEEYLDEEAEGYFFEGHPMAMPISGTEQSVKGFGVESLRTFYNEKYTAGNCIISVAGSATADDVVKALDNIGADVYSKATAPFDKECVSKRFDKTLSLGVEQVYAQYMLPACTASNDERFELSALNMILGGLMSSRLFQEVREKRGLCYNIETDMSLYAMCGALSVFFSCDRENLGAVEEITMNEIKRMAKHGITKAEFELAVNQMLYGFCSGLETSSGRMFSNLRQFFFHGKTVDSDNITKRIKSMTLSGVNSIAEKYYSAEESRCLILPSES
jgi:predicted Zn-dependent peptidase